MKNRISYILICLLGFTALALSGCGMSNQKGTNLSVIYALTAALSFVLLLSYCKFIRNKSFWFRCLFLSVFVVNMGYFSLSISSTLEQALMANRISYLGSVMLPLSMLMIILDATNTKYGKKLPSLLLVLSILVLLVAASPGISTLYYKEVSFAIINGTATLQKVYGPLHPLYLFYLLGYMAAMVAVILRASLKKQMETPTHAAILAAAVFVNIGVWLIEQLVHIHFEILSISYIISELFLLGVHCMASENKRLNELAKDLQTAPTPASPFLSEGFPLQPPPSSEISPEQLAFFREGLTQLTQTERVIYEAYIARMTTKELMASLNIKENTLKFHNKNIYNKLGVSSRNQLLEFYAHLSTSENKKQR